MPRTITQTREWDNWYEFKDELESKVGFYIPLYIWLEIRPKRPLPWHNGDFQTLVTWINSSNTIRDRAKS
jgi:hypothetical protein